MWPVQGDQVGATVEYFVGFSVWIVDAQTPAQGSLSPAQGELETLHRTLLALHRGPSRQMAEFWHFV